MLSLRSVGKKNNTLNEMSINKRSAHNNIQRTGLGVVGGFEKRPPGTEALLKN